MLVMVVYTGNRWDAPIGLVSDTIRDWVPAKELCMGIGYAEPFCLAWGTK
jgi:hypothetical protein